MKNIYFIILVNLLYLHYSVESWKYSSDNNYYLADKIDLYSEKSSYTGKLKRSINEQTSAIKGNQTSEITDFLGEIEDALRHECTDRNVNFFPSRYPAVEDKLFSEQISITKFLGEITATSVGHKEHLVGWNVIEGFASGALQSVQYLKSVNVYVQKSINFAVYRNLTKNRITFNNSSNNQETIISNMAELGRILGDGLNKSCKFDRSHQRMRVHSDLMWTKPRKDCNNQLVLDLFAIIYSCNPSTKEFQIKGYLETSSSLDSIDIDQCSNDTKNVFAGTNKCPPLSVCTPIKNYGLRDGGYTCKCTEGSPWRQEVMNSSLGHAPDARTCTNFVVSDLVFVSVLSAHVVIILGMLLPGILLVKLRKTKTLNFNFWQLYEVIIGGGLLIYLSVVVEYMENSNVTCILKHWLREIGFVIFYSSMVLKIHRVRIECRSRQAQRVLLRDKDLIRYLLIVLFLAMWQMVAWSVISIESIVDFGSKGMTDVICTGGNWGRVIEIEEFVVMACLMYLCCSLSPPPSFSTESRAISFAVVNEAIFSALHNVIKFLLRSVLTHRTVFLMSLIRCHLTITVNLIVLLSIKLWQARLSSHVSTGRRKDVSSNTKEALKTAGHEPLKNQSSSVSTSKKSYDSKEANDMILSGLNPEDVKVELRRLYKQLEIYKAKASRKDVSHAVKKQTTRKQGPRRFSLYNFHHARHSKHHPTLSDKNRCLDDSMEKEPGVNEQMKITPEESTNSCEVWNLAPNVS